MTLNEAREVLAGAAWMRKTPLVDLFDEIVERHDEPHPLTDAAGTITMRPGEITLVFADYNLARAPSGRVVQLLMGLRQQYGMALYEVTKEA